MVSAGFQANASIAPAWPIAASWFLNAYVRRSSLTASAKAVNRSVCRTPWFCKKTFKSIGQLQKRSIESTEEEIGSTRFPIQSHRCPINFGCFVLPHRISLTLTNVKSHYTNHTTAKFITYIAASVSVSGYVCVPKYLFLCLSSVYYVCPGSLWKSRFWFTVLGSKFSSFFRISVAYFCLSKCRNATTILRIKDTYTVHIWAIIFCKMYL